MTATRIDRTRRPGNAAALRRLIASMAVTLVLAGCAASTSRNCAQRSPVLLPTRTVAVGFDASETRAPAEIALADLRKVQSQTHQ
jgi:hypothetical protein